MKFVTAIALFYCTFSSTLSRAQYLKPLKIGDQISNLEVSNIINSPNSKINFKDFKGQALLLDFWAPWCSPCVEALPKITSLKAQFGDKLNVLLITKENREYSNKVLTNLNKDKKIGLFSSVVQDSILSRLFDHKVLPHYVWIDKNGVVQAITGGNELTKENVKDFIDSKSLKLPIKTDKRLDLDFDRPLFSTGQFSPGNALLVQSTITRYIQGLPTMSTQKADFIRCTSHSISHLYKMAFGKFDLSFLNNNRIILEGFKTREDSLLIGRYTSGTKNEWKKIMLENLYNYEIVFVDTLSMAEKFSAMQVDLNRYFKHLKIQGRLEKRLMKTLALIRTSAIDKIHSAGGNRLDYHSGNYLKISNLPINALVTKFQSSFYKEDALPIVDETKYNKTIDIEINVDLTDLTKVNKELEKYDLQFIEKENAIEMIIISKL